MVTRKSSAQKRQALSPTALPELPPSALRRTCDPAALGFKTTDELPELDNVIGQPRALRALEMGSAVDGPGFNIFVLGLPDSGRTTLVRAYLERKAASERVPDDWCYVNNFDNARTPTALRMPGGLARQFHNDMATFIQRCELEIPQAFESNEYTNERDALFSKLKADQDSEMTRLAEQAAEKSFALGRSPVGFVLAPADSDGRPLEPAEVGQLPSEQISKFAAANAELEGRVKDAVDHLRILQRSTHDEFHELNRRTMLFAVEHLLEQVKLKYANLPQVTAYLDTVKDDLVANTPEFFRAERSASSIDSGKESDVSSWLSRYEVNVLIDNAGRTGAPVVVENQPTYYNLLGRIEHELAMGESLTDYTMVRAGALHRANGGYLILPARDVLLNTSAWEGLKRILRDGSIRIIEPGTEMSLISTTSLEPQAIPLSIKVILVGTPLLYYLLSAYDEDFAKLFKVKAEFATSMNRVAETEHEYALYVKSVVDANHLPPFDNTAVAQVIEYGSRLVEDQGKLSTRFGKIADLIREAAYWHSKEHVPVITATAVEHALQEGTYRSNLLEERLQEMIIQGSLAIEVAGTAVGQINALSVLSLGDYSFGHPTRVTASARPGRGGIVDIERRAELGGPIHTKGVLILSGFLGERYGQNQPISLSASLAFEQSYEGVEGDSASAAELMALLSAIAEIPIRQDIAITGSINQHGCIQAIGGVNEKVEGFFAICKMLGLTGSQGVIIPANNVRNLMLSREVVQAVCNHQFHVWPVSTLDDAIAILTGCEPGKPNAEGIYPDGSFNEAVLRRLAAFDHITCHNAEPSERTEGEPNAQGL